MFQGSSALTLDAKGRMSIPTRHRDALIEREQGRLTLTRHPDGCLLVYPRSLWEQKRQQIAAFPMSARALQRLLLGSAQDVDMDSAGRILVAPELRSAVGLEREAMLLGLGGHFELWNAAELERRQAEELAQGMSDVFEQFSF
ncbi:division/cell wall cluster transcriptional repressor MraZ [Paenalcaligenes niemegkensis]|uniref:division/cell wall cluster transcriptional repressor MraZ n=1 Tax=Paenalcaligenes niemegkensis TaxID=2895469 RepID=UPI001EE8DB53|nr:division/cell wall cluster transcriptional repressor MraZ [Paenalcaligenes niemegkensis]MCQ9615882.1 division/cell wall cluster transcriptional repressor MraZ [Paenalcaligenes niemegkensis]